MLRKSVKLFENVCLLFLPALPHHELILSTGNAHKRKFKGIGDNTETTIHHDQCTDKLIPLNYLDSLQNIKLDLFSKSLAKF